jgi:hypothetical protein
MSTSGFKAWIDEQRPRWIAANRGSTSAPSRTGQHTLIGRRVHYSMTSPGFCGTGVSSANKPARWKFITSVSSLTSPDRGQPSPRGTNSWPNGGARPSWSAPHAITTSTPGSPPQRSPRNHWRAACSETGTSGSAGGRAEKEPLTRAPRRAADPTQAGKGLAGLDEHQVRRWTSRRRWTPARHDRARPARRDRPHEHTDRPTPAGLIALTCNEIRGLFTIFVIEPGRTPGPRQGRDEWALTSGDMRA